MGLNYLFIFSPCYVGLCASKARHRLGNESVSWCLETSGDGAPYLPILSLFFFFLSFIFNIFPTLYFLLFFFLKYFILFIYLFIFNFKIFNSYMRSQT